MILRRVNPKDFVRANCILRRHYAMLPQKAAGWAAVFNPKASRKSALSQFKRSLLKSIEENSNLEKGSREYEVIDSLAHSRNITTRKLYELILQHRIEEQEIWEAITRATHKKLVNVSMPKSMGKNTSYDMSRNHQLLFIRPQKLDHLDKALRKIQEPGSKAEDNNTLLKIDGEQKVKENLKSSEAQQNQQSIDVRSLRDYLQTAEKQEKQRRKYAWEEQKHYNWNQSLREPLDLSAGQIVFANLSSRRSGISFFERLFSKGLAMPSSIDHKSDHAQPKELLIYEVNRKLKRVASLTDDNSLFNINYKDLFGIINSCDNPPEETLRVINHLESEGWKLVGDLYDNSQSIVFQRTGNRHEKNDKKKKVFDKKTFILTSMALVFVYGAVQFAWPYKSNIDQKSTGE